MRIHQFIKGGVIACWLSLQALVSWAQSAISIPFQSTISTGTSFQAQAQIGVPFVFTDSGSGRYFQSFFPDSLWLLTDSNYAAHEIRYIPDQSGIAGNTNLIFYVKCDSLPQLAGQAPPRFSMTLLTSGFSGSLRFNARSRMFSASPLATDTALHQVLFRCIRGNDTIQQIVKIQFSSPITEEEISFGLPSIQVPPSKTAREYVVVSPEVNISSSLFNGQIRNIKRIEVSGIDLIVDNDSTNYLSSLNGRLDIQSLRIYADRLIIRTAWNLPSTNLSIHCREIIFEDPTVGPHAVINTTPLTPLPRFGTDGISGQNGGGIDLFINGFFQEGNKFRFILLGGNGGATSNATSGRGGNGGTLFSSIPIDSYVDNQGGLAGVLNTPANGAVGSPYRGEKGLINVVDFYKTLFFHPNYLRLLNAYWSDCFYLGRFENLPDTIRRYLEISRTIIPSLKDTNTVWWLPDRSYIPDIESWAIEAQALLNRIESNLDFYGNPIGWTSKLSFEIAYQAFNSELNHSIRLLYLDYFFTKSAETLQGQVASLNVLAQRVADQYNLDRSNFLDLTNNKLPSVSIRIEESFRRMAILEKELNQIVQDVERRQREAREKALRKARWIAVAKTVGKVTSMLPIPGASTVGGTITAGASLYENLDNQGNIGFNWQTLNSIGDAVSDGYAVFKSANEKMADSKSMQLALNAALAGFTGGGSLSNTDPKLVSEAVHENVTRIKEMVSEANATYKKSISASKAAIEKTLSIQFANVPELIAARKALLDATREHVLMVNEFNAYTNESMKLASELTTNALVFDHARARSAVVGLNIDHRAIHQMKDLTRNCINRLRKYHYYMARAYDYRTLKSYSGNLNVQVLYNSIKSMVDAANVLDSNSAQLNLSQFQALASLYEEQIRQIADQTYQSYQQKAPTQTIEVSVNLLQEDIDRLNAGDTILFNPVKRGVFIDNEENHRINSIRISKLKLKQPNGTVGSPAFVDLGFNYPNESKTKFDGKVYRFTNFSLDNQTALNWRTRFNYANNSLISFKPSVLANSFLSAILTNSIVPGAINQKLPIYYQPLADADMLMYIRSFNNNGTANFQIDSCEITIDYDFTEKPANTSYLDVQAFPEWIVPDYRISRIDNSGKKDGQGQITRAYPTSNSTLVQLSAEPRIGKFRFERWLTNFNGRPDTSQDATRPSRQVIMSSNRSFIAKYKYAGPVMKVPDTILVRFLNQPVSLTVQNVGEDQGMEWFVDSSSTGISLATSVPKGVDQGSFNFSVTDTSRLKYIFLASPDALNGFDTTVVLFRKPDATLDTVRQSFCFGGSINIPGIGVVSQAGSYRDTLPGDTIIKLYVVTVNPLPNPILSNALPQVICAGNSSILNIVSPQPDWQINWFKNGILVGNGPQIALGGLNSSNDWYRARVINVNGCQQFTDSVNIQIQNFVTPQVNVISNQPQNTLCSGSSITFTAQPTDPGTAPMYQWLLNGNPITSATGTSFTSSSLTNNALISVRMTANNQCQNVNQVTSQAISVTVNAPVVPAVSISSTNVSACQGDSVFIQSIGVNMGSNPRYSWSINQQLVDTTNALRTASIQNGDTVRVLVRTNAVCQTVDSVWSNALIFNITPKVNPSVSFALPTNAICAATGFTFIATPINGGPSPVYQWRVNGQVVGGNSNSYVYNNPVNGDLVTVSMSANNACQNYALANGNLYAVTSIPAVVPTLSISNLPTAPLCNARPFTFQTTTVNGGPAPQFQWLINGQPVLGANGASFNYTAPQNGQVVSVQLTPNNACQTTNQVNSSYNVQALSAVTPSVTSIASSISFCEGAQEAITAFPQQGGTAPFYEWRVNGVVQTGQNSATFTMNGLLSGSSSVQVRMIANNSCQTLDTAVANPVSVVVNPIPSKPVISRVGQVLTSSAPSGNQWYRNGQLISGANGISLTPTTFGSYTVTTTVNSCTSPQSDTVLFIPTGIIEGGISSWRYYPNPASELVNISLEISEAKRLQIQLIDLQGRVVKWVDLGVIQGGLFTTQFSVDDVSNGLYMIRISSDDEFKLGKLQVTR